MRALLWPLSLMICIACAQEAPDGDAAARDQADSNGLELTVTDAVRIAGGEIVIVGQIVSGRVSVGDEVCLISAESGAQTFTVAAMESFNRIIETAEAGTSVGLMVDGEIDPDDVASGDTIRNECS